VSRLYLVRHGRASAGWDTDPDPGLDDVGRAQAEAVTERLASVGPLPIRCSPLRRTRETAAPLAERWRVEPMIDPAVGELPSPEGVSMADRGTWLRAAVLGNWTELGPRYTAFRDAVVAHVRALSEDTVVVSHFIAINAVIGAAVDDDRVVVLSLDNASCTVIDVDDGRITLHAGGHEADTLIR
jgi:broad specificity phosphatase PhoE